MMIGSGVRSGVLGVAAPRVSTSAASMMWNNITATNKAHRTWGIETQLTNRATRGLFVMPDDNDGDIDYRATGGLLS